MSSFPFRIYSALFIPRDLSFSLDFSASVLSLFASGRPGVPSSMLRVSLIGLYSLATLLPCWPKTPQPISVDHK
ncbi:unnamed protein product, partial [Nesidiocoris tenuis]